ncbi:hypothetical protein [Litoribrevibacter albus]|uniref:Uncharacterized protein n=1 Tax=Litoribrevibacter albus TaxID=1473156 RepID=A0AA37S9K9_9GAMM|nr:hypothetical protein [Litoribrevibacter albus]GLQ30901.1 hypothetical protein GCM10007876_13800 [Litoribrevibacter albus]
MSKAIQAQAWYLANLLALPGLSFLVLLYLYLKYVRPYQGEIRDQRDLELSEDSSLPKMLTLTQQELDASHIRSAFWLSVIGGGSVIGGCGLLFLLTGNNAKAWVMIVLYFTVLHTSFVLWGMFNLAKAWSSKLPFFKLI